MYRKSTFKINFFKYPASDQLNGRSSTICRSMACTLLERRPCSLDEEKKWISFFSDKKCAYCGKTANHLDHLHALILDRKPTGYGTEAANLVPCCKECNQSKGNLEWEDFMRSPKCNHIEDSNLLLSIEKRINVIKSFEKTMQPRKLTISDEIMTMWIDMLDGFDKSLKDAQIKLAHMKSILYNDKK